MQAQDEDEWLGDDSANERVPERPERTTTRRARLTADPKVPRRQKDQQTRLPTDLTLLRDTERKLRAANIGQQLTDDTSRRALLSAVVMQLEYLQQKNKEGKSSTRKLPPSRIRERVCRYLGIGTLSYGNIIGSYFGGESAQATIYTPQSRKGNSEEKAVRIPHTVKVQIATRDFVRSKRMRRERVTARQVMDMLVEKRWLMVKKDAEGRADKTSFASAYRCVRRFLSRLGFRRGKRSNNIALKESIRVKRCAYLRILRENQKRPDTTRLREVYLDESYIHQHYHRFEDSVWDPNDDQDVQFGKVAGGGRRYCFMAAIQSANPRSTIEDRNHQHDLAGVVPNTYWRFCPSRKREQNGDYRKAFNGENFAQWWRERLLPNLTAPSLIIMDNASYHRSLPASTPSPTTMRKSSCIEYLTAHCIPHSTDMGAVELKSLVRSHIQNNVKPEVVQLAEAQGHVVLFTPPYHSDLQPIELLWARVKGNVGRKYNSSTTLDDVVRHLDAEFENLRGDTGRHREDGRSHVEAMIATTTAISQAMAQDEIDDEEADGELSSDEESSSDSGSGSENSS